MGLIIVVLLCAIAMAAALHRDRHANGTPHQFGPFQVRVNPAKRGLFRARHNPTD